MAEDLIDWLPLVQAMLAGTVATPCGVEDSRGQRCGLEAGHKGTPRHCRLAVPGEAPYLEGPGNSVITWTGKA